MEELHDAIKLRGCIELYLLDAQNGRVVHKEKIDNTVVTSGRAWVLMRLNGSTPDTNTLNYIGLGTSTTAPTTADTALNSEVSSMRKTVGTWDLTHTTSSTPWIQGQVSYATNEGNTTIGEAGFFNHDTTAGGGTMLSHVSFSSINKTTSNTLTISYTISN